MQLLETDCVMTSNWSDLGVVQDTLVTRLRERNKASQVKPTVYT